MTKPVTKPVMQGVLDLEQLDRHFGALAHRTRRAILLVLHANGGTMTSGAIADRFDCTWQTTSRHLRLLDEAGLINVALQGRERSYELDARFLQKVTAGFIDRFDTEQRPSS